MSPPANAYDWFVANTNARVVRLLDENHSVSGFMMSLLDYLTRYAEDKGIDYKEIILDQPFIGDDEYIRAKIAIKRV